MALGQRLIQPLWWVTSQTRKQNQVGAACDDMNRVDLQQLHALNATAQAQAGGSGFWRVQQALRGQLKMARLCKAEFDLPHIFP